MLYEVSNLKYSYRNHKEVLSGVNLKLSEGELLCVLGRNGSGKSTLFSCLLGLLKPYEGSIKLQGKELSFMKEREIASVASYVPQQSVSSFGFTVFEYVLMGCASSVGLFAHPGKQEISQAWGALELMGISDYKDRIITELSGGERQQVTIARALASNPKVIMFDEPTAHLDYANQIKVLRVIKKLSSEGYAIAVTTHDPNHAILLGGMVALLDGNGGLKLGNSSAMLTEDMLSKIYGSDLKIRNIDEFKRNVCLYPNL